MTAPDLSPAERRRIGGFYRAPLLWESWTPQGADYLVEVQGCDDTTKVVVSANRTQAVVLLDLADAVTAAAGGCQPTMLLRLTEQCPCAAEYPPDEDCEHCDGLGAVPL